MTQQEQLRLCLLLAFQSVVSGDKRPTQGTKKKVLDLAKLMNAFCDAELNHAFPEQTISLVDDKSASKVDAHIAMYREELQKHGKTQLPKDHENLVQLYDRLNQRAFRARNWLFYADAKEEQLSEAIELMLIEEIKSSGGSIHQ